MSRVSSSRSNWRGVLVSDGAAIATAPFFANWRWGRHDASPALETASPADGYNP
jgi:hypothetical protein